MKKNLQNWITAITLVTFLNSSYLSADGWFDSFMGSIFGSSQSSKPSNNNYSSSYSTNNSNNHINSQKYSLSEEQAKSYVNQMAASFDLALRPYINSTSDFQYFKTLTIDNILPSPRVYKYTPYGKRYDKDLIDQYINGGILQYIEEKSYSEAYLMTNNRTVARKIAKSMFNNALAVIVKNNAIDMEAVAQFVGAALRRAIQNELLKYDVPYQPDYNNMPANDQYDAPPAYEAPPAYSPSHYSDSDLPAYENVASQEKNYPSQDCCVCYDTLHQNNRVFLRPCGHDICKTCIYGWFFGSNQNKTCPQCRANVNFERLNKDLAS